MIKVNGRVLAIPDDEKVIGFVGDNLIEVRQFEINDEQLLNFSFKLDLRIAEFVGIIDLTKNGNILTWTIEKEHLPQQGVVDIQLRAFSGDDEIWHSEIAQVHAGDSINATDYFSSPLPSEFEQMEQRITQKAEQVEEWHGDVDEWKDDTYGYSRSASSSANDASRNKDDAETAKGQAEVIKSDVQGLKTDVQTIKGDCQEIYNQQAALLTNTPEYFFKEDVEGMEAITIMKHGDFCIIITNDTEAQAVYRYYTKDIEGNDLVSPAWVWMTDMSLVSLTKPYLMGILQLANVADSGSYNDLTDKPKRYESFITVDDGVWNYNLSDKILLVDSNLAEINNVTNGAIGLINTTYDLTLPLNSRKALDYDYVELEAGQLWQYTFQYDGSNYYWSRAVIDVAE